MIVAERIRYQEFIAQGAHLYVPHYAEVPYASGKLEQDIDHVAYQAMEDNGSLHIVVAKEAGVLVGYMAVTIHDLCHHSGKLRACTDTFYVMPEYRSKGVMRHMTQFLEVECTVAGIAAIQIVTNANFKGAEEAATALGYSELETTWVKEL